MMRDGVVVAAIFAVPIVLAGVFAALAGAMAWSVAPPVAGEWYPYIRAGVAVLAAVVGAKVGVVVGVLVMVAGGAVFG